MTTSTRASASVRVNVEATSISARAIAVVGTVVEVGDAATEWMGRRVIVPTLASCGECDFCRRGAPWGCAAAVRLRPATEIARHIDTAARYAAAADGELAVPGASAAVLGGDGLRAYAAYCALGVAPAEPVVAVGDGTRSRLLRQIATARSAAVTPLAVAIEEARDKPWRAFALDATTEDIAALAAALPPGSNLAIASDDTGLRCQLELTELADRGISVAFVGEGHPDLLPELVALAARRELDLAATVTELAVTDASAEAIAAITSAGLSAVVHAT